MASLPTTCEICGQPCRLIGSGGATLEDLQNGPQVHTPGTEGDKDCFVEWQKRDAARKVAEAEANLAAARALVASAEAASTSAEGEPHEFTVAELKTLAEQKGITLGEATRKGDILEKVLQGLTVVGLREFARDNGIDLHGAQGRGDITARIRQPAGEGAQEEPTPFNSESNVGFGQPE